jgi:TonB family protein
MRTPLRQGAFAFALLIATFVLAPIHSWAQDSTDGGRKILVKTLAVYPPLARSMNIRGIAKVEAHVEPNGSVKSVVVKGGHPILVQSAVTAVGHWKFEPAAHETKELIEIKFDLE